VRRKFSLKIVAETVIKPIGQDSLTHGAIPGRFHLKHPQNYKKYASFDEDDVCARFHLENYLLRNGMQEYQLNNIELLYNQPYNFLVSK
jgi:hypothetical protein